MIGETRVAVIGCDDSLAKNASGDVQLESESGQEIEIYTKGQGSNGLCLRAIGFTRCSDCDVDLVDHLPADPAVVNVPHPFGAHRFQAEPKLVVIQLVADQLG